MPVMSTTMSSTEILLTIRVGVTVVKFDHLPKKGKKGEFFFFSYSWLAPEKTIPEVNSLFTVNLKKYYAVKG